MTKRLESDIEKDFVQYAETVGCEAFKFTSPGRRGVPDRMVIGPGFLFFIEFKRPGEKPTKQQEKMRKRLGDFGQDVFVCDNLEQAKAVLDNIRLP